MYILNRQDGDNSAVVVNGMHVGYVQCKQYGFFADEILSPHLPLFLLQIVFYEDKSGIRSTSFYYASMYRTIGKHTCGTRQAGVNDPTGLAHIQVWQVIVRLSQDLKT